MKFQSSDDFSIGIPFELSTTIPERFAQVCQVYGDNIAVETRDAKVTYSQLEYQAKQIANYLLMNVKENSGRVMMSVPRAHEMLAAIMGTLMSGKTYIPVDSSLGIRWLEFITDDVKPEVILTIPNDYELINLAKRLHIPLIFYDEMLGNKPLEGGGRALPDSPASILYTSGSTGEPKGVVQNHRNIMFHIELLTKFFQISSTDKHTLLPSFIHDASTTDIYCTLLNGAVLNPFNLKKEGFIELPSYIKRSKVRLFHSTPTVFREMVHNASSKDDFTSVRAIILGGEPVRKEDVLAFRSLFPERCLFINGYGATETTGFVALNVIRNEEEIEDGIIPIGTAPEGIELLFVDENKDPVDSEGEIAVECKHIALGYLNKDEASTKVYRNGFKDKNSRVYLTGDYGVRTVSGKIQLMGRKDRQIKVRGYRIELAEIESVIAQISRVKQVAVCMNENHNELVAFLVINNNDNLEEKEIRDIVSSKLPQYMVPLRFIKLDKMPLTNTNKIDYKKLLETRQQVELQTDVGNDIKSVVLHSWKKVLSNPNVALDEHVFDIGASSIHVMRVQSLISDKLNISVPLVRFFEYPTISSFISYLENNEDTSWFGNIENRLRNRLR
jgi:amino acid adenylation domain-containing protein